MPDENIQATPETPTTTPPAGEDTTALKNAYEKTKQELAAIKAMLQQAEVTPKQLPDFMQQIRQYQQEQQVIADTVERAVGETKSQYEKRLAEAEAQAQRNIAEAQSLAAKERQQRLEVLQQIELQQHYNSQAKPEFSQGFNEWFAIAKNYIEFEEGTSNVKAIRKANGDQLFVTDKDGTARPAAIADFFDAAIKGDYGPMVGAALRPYSEATGGGAVTPGRNFADGKLRITTAQLNDIGSMSPEQISKISKGQYVLVDG